MTRRRRLYAVYLNDEFVMIGTAIECARAMGVKPEYIKWGTTPTASKRIAGRKTNNKTRRVMSVAVGWEG